MIKIFRKIRERMITELPAGQTRNPPSGRTGKFSKYILYAILLSISERMIGIASKLDSETDFIKFGSTVTDIFTTPEMFNKNDYAFLNKKDNPEFKLFVRSMSSLAFYQKVNNSYRSELIKKCTAVLKSIDQELKK